MTQPAPPQQSNAGVIAAAAIGLALIAVEAQVRQQVEEDIAVAVTATAAVLAAALATALIGPAAIASAVELLSQATVHNGIHNALETGRSRVRASIASGYTAGANVALARARQDLGDDIDMPELDPTLDVLSGDVDTMFRHAEADITNSVRVAYDGVQGPDADRLRPVVVDQAVQQAAARLQQRAAATAGTAVNQGAADAQQAIWTQYQNTHGGLVYKRWVVTASDPCAVCLALDGTLVAVSAEFDHDAGSDTRDWRPVWRNLLGPPRHPNCRCQLELVRR